MHGVKRLFAWMIPRFDETRFNVSLVSLRKKDLSEETLDSPRRRHRVPAPVEVRSRDAARAAEDHRPQADRHPAPARLRRDDVRPAGGRDAAAADDPARAREPDRHAVVPEGGRPPARAVHGHRDRGVAEHGGLRARTRGSCRPEKIRSSTSARRSRSSGASRTPRRWPRRERRSASRPDDFAIGTITRLHDSKGNEYLVEAARRSCDRHPDARFFLAGEGPLRAGARSAGAGAGPRRSVRVRRLREGRGGDALGVRPERASRRCGKARRSPRSRRWPWARPSWRPTPTACSTFSRTDTYRVDRPEARRGGAGRRHRARASSIPTSARAMGARARTPAARFRHRRVRAEDGAALHAARTTCRGRRSGRASCAKTCRSWTGGVPA